MTCADNILQADRWNTSALGEVFSGLVSAACGTERKRVYRKNIVSTGLNQAKGLERHEKLEKLVVLS